MAGEPVFCNCAKVLRVARQFRGIEGHAERSRLRGFAVDLVLLHQRKHLVGRGARESQHPASHLLAEIGDHLFRVGIDAGIDLAAIAARSAPARLMRLQHHGIDAAFGQMQCRRQPRVPATDDDDGSRDRGIQFGHRGQRRAPSRHKGSWAGGGVHESSPHDGRLPALRSIP